MEHLELEQVTQPQLDQLVSLWLESNFQGHPFIPKAYWLENQTLVRESLPQARLFVKEIEGEVVGFLGLIDTYIAGVFVKERFQKQGVGKELLENAKREVEILSLEVFEKNKKAFEFYLKQGFHLEKSSINEETKEIECLLTWRKK